MRSKPLGRDGATDTPTDGDAFPLPTTGPAVQQIKVYVSAAAYVGMGNEATPPAASSTNSVYQEATTEVIYTLDGEATRDPAYIYVYAVATTITTHVSFFG